MPHSSLVTRDKLERWLAHDQPEVVTEFSQITVGIANETYLVRCSSGRRYVIRKLLTQAVESARTEALIQQSLMRSGISSPVYIPFDNGEVVGRDGEDHFTISSFIEGKHPTQVSLELVSSFGKVMATLHQILDPTQIHIPYNSGQWLNPRNVVAEISHCQPDKREQLQALVDRSAAVFEQNLPRAIIHGELAANNVFAEGDRVTTVFDFETVEYAPRILDFAYTLLSIAYDQELDPDRIYHALRQGYESTATLPLTIEEKNSLQPGDAPCYRCRGILVLWPQLESIWRSILECWDRVSRTTSDQIMGPAFAVIRFST